MSNIAVYTFSNSYDNYGEVLQYYATQKFLSQRGHHVTLLRFGYNNKCLSFLKKCIKRLLPKRKRILVGEEKIFHEWHEWSNYYSRLHPRHFEKFRRQYFDIKEYSAKDETISDYDVFVTGSDQTWGGVNPNAFLVYANKTSKKIAIAPSTGGYKFTQSELSQIHDYLSTYNQITVREESALDMCKAAGIKNAKVILDPVFLLNADEYSLIADKQDENRPYLFLYLLGAEIDFEVEEILSFANSNNLKVKYVASQGRHDDYDKIWATVPEWISLIKNADYVITNSYHGAAFSIIFRKHFLVLPIKGVMERMNTRIVSTMRKLNLTNRIVSSGDMNVIFDDIDYSTAENKIKENICILGEMLKSEGL